MAGSVIWAGAKTFLGTSVGKGVMLSAALAAWTTFHRLDSAKAARTTCEAAALEAALVEQNRQLQAARVAAQEAREQADATALEISEMKGTRDELLKAIESDPDGVCAIPPDLADRLRGIEF